MTQDTRKDRRVKIVSLNVRYKSATVDEFIENHAHDVSRGGIFIKTGNPFPPGTLLKFEIRLASDQAVIAGVGRIVWKRDAGIASVESPAGMGVKFIKIDEPSKAVIDRLVATRGDAGRAFENEEALHAERSFSRSSPPLRPSVSPTTPPPAGAGGSTPPAGGAAGAKTPSARPVVAPGSPRLPSMPTTAATPFARKATIMGMGTTASRPARSSSPPAPQTGTGSNPPAPRVPFSSAPPVAPPRPAAAMAMFPRPMDDDSEMPPKEDQTVMRQAAELLEDALREAGGSMAEIGQNPLFSANPPAASGSVPTAKGPPTPGAEWTAADTPKALAAAVAARREEHASAHEASGDAGDRGLGVPASARSALTSVRPAAGTPSGEPTPSSGKKGSTAFLWAVVAIAAVAVAVIFREQLFGRAAPAEPSAAPTAMTAPAATSPAPASNPPAATIASPAASSEVPAPPASAQPPASASAHSPEPAPPKAPMVYVPPRPRPVAKVAPPPAAPPATAGTPAPAVTAAPPAEATTAAAEPAPTTDKPSAAPPETASSSAIPGAPKPSPPAASNKARSGKPSDDSNPY